MNWCIRRKMGRTSWLTWLFCRYDNRFPTFVHSRIVKCEHPCVRYDLECIKNWRTFSHPRTVRPRNEAFSTLVRGCASRDYVNLASTVIWSDFSWKTYQNRVWFGFVQRDWIGGRVWSRQISNWIRRMLHCGYESGVTWVSLRWIMWNTNSGKIELP